ncbi:beta-ketoacyl-[acyl-carrier-protein] synthase family protein [bacterium SCSIO 12741]|nr:beta-ketoacyl-[acyl-carrier-protein] synthase family protein [bacterium SCSIO 12741]
MEKRVVITGMGAYSCLGTTLEEVTESLRTGRSGIQFDPQRKEMGFRSALTGMVPTPNLKGMLKRRQRVGMAEEVEYAYMSTIAALNQAGVDQDYLDNNIVGILFGNDSSARAVVESTDIVRAKKDTTLVGSGMIFQSMNSTVTMNLATIFRLKGINFTISAACASGSHSIGLGYMMIKQGFEKMVICGGAQEINAYAMASFDGLGTFSTKEEEPSAASRPFDKNRDGLVPSGGAATVILEDLESALARGANILGEVMGYGFSSNGDHISNPNVDGPVRSLNMALDQAKMSEHDIDYINAHATSTPVGDANEARAIHQVFGRSKPPVSSTKSMTGHECWMAGASEVVYSMLMMQNGFVAPNINLEEPDEHSADLNIARDTQKHNIDVFLSNSFGFGGTNSSLVIRKFEK